MIQKLALGLAFGVLLFFLALRGVPMADLGAAFARMQWTYLLHVTVTFVAQYAIRAWRQLVLVRPLAPATTFRRQLGIVMIGFLCVNVFPIRLGEPVRAYLLYEKDGIPFGAGLGVSFVDRLLDIVALFVVLLALLIWVELPDREVELLGRSLSLVELGRGAALATLPPALIAFAGLVLLGRRAVDLGVRIVGAIEARFRAPALHRVLRFALRFAEGIVEGMAPLRSPSRLALVVFQTALLFVTMGLLLLWLARAFDLDPPLGFAQNMGVLIVTMLGIALPAPPGFAGVFEAAARAGLALFGVAGEAFAGRALAYALVLHWWPFLLLVASGSWFLWRDGVELGRLFRFARGSGSRDAD